MICTKCGSEKEDEEFNFKNYKKGIRHKHCKLCSRLYGKLFYEAHRRERIALSRKRVPKVHMQNVRNLVEYLFNHPCVDCGEDDPLCLDFDHVNGRKHKNITTMLPGHSWQSILKEIGKCLVRCANCHRRRTAIQRSWKKISVIKEFMHRKTNG